MAVSDISAYSFLINFLTTRMFPTTYNGLYLTAYFTALQILYWDWWWTFYNEFEDPLG